MDKVLLDAVGEVIKKALASSDGRIRSLENHLALVKDNYEAAILEIKAKSSEDVLRLTGSLEVMSAELEAAKTVIERQEKELQSVNMLAVKLGIEDIPNLRKSMQSTLAESQLTLLLRVDDVAKGLEEHEERVGQLEDIAGGTGVDLENLKVEVNKRFSATSELVDLHAKRICADTKSHPAYVGGDVVRAGDVRRFGFCGLFEAIVDTAKGVLEAPDSWLMLSDGLYIQPDADGTLIKSFSGNYTYAIPKPQDGAEGKEGQRGKQGEKGLRGNDGVGVDDVITTDTGMYVSLTNSKHYHFDFTPQLERAIRDVAPRIEQIAINAVINGGGE